jgi:hypothetical protein
LAVVRREPPDLHVMRVLSHTFFTVLTILIEGRCASSEGCASSSLSEATFSVALRLPDALDFCSGAKVNVNEGVESGLCMYLFR